MSEQRIPLLVNWLNQIPQKLGLKIDTLAPASSDASFRRYFRIASASGTLVVMDAPPPKEDCGPFVDIAGRLTAAGLNVPKVIEMDLKQGFLLLSDLGPTTYYDKIVSGVEDFT
jgi:aminoglycoside/choline kinase family phosphotransferase